MIDDSKQRQICDKLKGIIPDSVLVELPNVIEKFQINTPLRLAHFLSQCDHESVGFKITTENLNYSGDRLLVIFPKYFKTIQDAVKVARNPDAIANIVYGGRMGNNKLNDGKNYKGRGFIMLTGKDNYTLFDKVVDDDILNNPDLVATKYPLLSAAFFWNSVNLNSIADKNNDISVRKAINGGQIGIEDCRVKFKKYYNILK